MSTDNRDLLLIYKFLKLSFKLKLIIIIFYKLAKIYIIEMHKVIIYNFTRRLFALIYSFIILVIIIASLSLFIYNYI
jgi:hypothetical protein